MTLSPAAAEPVQDGEDESHNIRSDFSTSNVAIKPPPIIQNTPSIEENSKPTSTHCSKDYVPVPSNGVSSSVSQAIGDL